ncbi:choice-of-anchor P family protein [Saccharothrix lopnurensis]|uniref:Choice-of-anchor P family protein n=1 Tax=Saccharothrix lopnurensis TaxID=1670621 RepID=A0ABW1P9I3_9PSEU
MTTSSPTHHRRRLLPAITAALTAVPLSVALAAVHPVTATAEPGVPQAPVVVFAEDFENGQGTTPALLTAYTGLPPVNQTYDADPAWLTACNGWLASLQQSTTPPPGSGCGSGDWQAVRTMAGALGQWAGGDPGANHAVTAYTAGNPGAGKVQLATEQPIPLAAPDRFLTFSVDAAERNCFANHALFEFYLVDGATAIPTFTTPIEPCANPSTVIGGTAVGTYTSDRPVLFGGSSVGVRLVNAQASGTGNDAAFDNVRVLDVTPQLDVAYGPSPVEVGQTSTLVLTVTNTAELAVKDGWAFTADLPTGLTATAQPTTDCADATTSTAAGAVTATGGLATGQVSCTISVPVTAARAGTYTTCAADVTARVGLNAPGCASVRFTPPVLVFDAHAHGGRLTAPLVGVGPLAPSDLSCTTQPGLDVDQLLGAGLPGIGSLGVVDTEARGVVDGDGERTATAHARTAGVSLLGGLVTADEIRARAAADEDATGAVTTAGGVELVNLRVNGVPVVNPAVDLTITIPLVATVVVNEQRSLAGGAGIAVNALRVRLLTGTELVISHARVTLTRPGAPCPTS